MFSNIAGEVLNIKKKFTELYNKKIKNIQKIIRDKNKSKPKLNIITKELSYKQVIIPINSNNNVQFIKNTSTYITNINRALKNSF